MKPQRDFVAERPLARHDAALLRAGPGPAELLPALARAAERLSRSLRGALAPLLSGEPPRVTCGDPVETTFADFASKVPRLAGNSLFVAGAQGSPLLSTIDAGTVLRLVDRAFGGAGEAPHTLPREFPMSAELMIARLETILGGRLAAALGAEDPEAIRPLRRDGNIAQLQAFPEATRLAVIELSVEETDKTPWSVRIAFPFASLADLFGHGERPPAARPPKRPSDPDAQPFADMPLPVSALLVDVALPLSAISTLKVGQVLAVPVARSVPLRVAGKTIAHGSIGAIDDRVAVQITQLS